MTQRFIINICRDSTAATCAEFRVEVQSGLVRVREIRVQCGADGSSLPHALASFDYSTFVSMAVGLSKGQFPAPEGADGNQQSAKNHSGSGDLTGGRTTRISTASTIRSSIAGGHGDPISKTGVPPDLARVYWRLGSIVKVAKHYDVPRQIAKDWVRELKGQKAIATPWKSAPSSRRGRPQSTH